MSALAGIRSKQRFLLATLLLFVVMLSVAVARTRARPVWQQKVDDWILENSQAGKNTEFLVILQEQADLADVGRLNTKRDKGTAMYERLTAIARQTQAPLIAELEEAGVAFRPYWISNMIWVRGDRRLVESMARRADVSRLHANPWTKLDTLAAPQDRQTEGDGAEIEWNIRLVNAPAAWAFGVTGQGAVVGGQDTGYEWRHPALINKYRGWDGQTANHDYSWHDAIHEDNPHSSSPNTCGFDSPEPCDDQAHGTHTMGTMVGDDGAGNQIGMAPGAQWIGCRNMEEGWGTPATYAECYEWFVAPYPIDGDPFTDGDPQMAPHVINNSWSCPAAEGCTEPDVLLAVVNNMRAAGIVTVHSASNEGPRCGSVSDPAAIYDASFTVGATNNSDQITSFSSRGPAPSGDALLLKPDISAPGAAVRSSVAGGHYGTFSGTSMAAPHVAGLVALLIAADPDLAGNVDALEKLIQDTAIVKYSSDGCGSDGPQSVPNNTYGWGRIDAFSAIKSAVGLGDNNFYLPVSLAP